MGASALANWSFGHKTNGKKMIMITITTLIPIKITIMIMVMIMATDYS